MSTIESILTDNGDFAHGGDLAGTAAQWERAGFDADDVSAWLEARCFDPQDAMRLRAAGITPEAASEVIDVEFGGYRDTIGYAVSNGDMSLADAMRATGRVLTFAMVECERLDGLYLSDGVNPPSGEGCKAILVTHDGGVEYGAWRHTDGSGDAERFPLAELLEND